MTAPRPAGPPSAPGVPGAPTGAPGPVRLGAEGPVAPGAAAPRPAGTEHGVDPYPSARDRDRDRRGGGGAAGPHRRTPLAWLPWAALAALLALLALALLATRLGDGSGGAASTSGSSAQREAAGSDAQGGSAAGEQGAGQGAEQGAGSITVGSTDVLAGSGVTALQGLTGQDAVVRGALVESVVADEGFWVGSGPERRVFVFLTPQARQSAGESAFQVEAGQRVDVNATVEALPGGGPAEFGVEADEGADQLTEQGAYLRALQVRLAS